MNKYKSKIGLQFKKFCIDQKDITYDSEKRVISGYAAIFGNIDKAGDMLVKGCFTKSIQERGPESSANDKIIFLWMHNMDEPIGFPTVLREDDRGLYFEAYVDDVPRGNQAITQLESGTLNQFSIGFQYVWEKCEWDDERGCLIVKEVKLYEFSVVSIGANGDTEYLGLKSIKDIEAEYKKLADEISSFCSGMNISKQQKLQKMISKAMSLAVFEPDDHQMRPLDKEAGKQEKSMFDFKRKNV
mgnify:FL=1|jgi:HK97 family phage prohead protease